MHDLLRNPPDLEQKLRDLLCQIPRGRVTTYGALALALGDRIATRWVGHFMLHHDHGSRCPCHRVVRADGSLGLYVEGRVEAKATRLVAEGIGLEEESLDLSRWGFDRFRTDRPLERLRRVQEALLEKLSLAAPERLPELVGGVDVSYRNGTGGSEAVAAYALVSLNGCELVWSKTIRRPVRFPYISSFLAFRELPILLDLLDLVCRAGRLAEVVLVDGSGILHPRRAGIATHLAVAAKVATVGVTKKLLCGRVAPGSAEPRDVRHEGRTIGLAFHSTPAGRKRIFVSPGNGVSVAYCRRLVPQLLRGHKLPEPLYWADRLSRKDARGPLSAQSSTARLKV